MEDKDTEVLEEEKDVSDEEEKVQEEKEDVVEAPGSDEEQDEVVAEEAVEDHAVGDEDKWMKVFNRLDALEERVGELMMQGGPEKADMEEETEVSDIEKENQKWYSRNAQRMND